MCKGKKIGIILFAIALAVNITIGSGGAAATELIVHKGESIQAAVNNSKSGDTIIVESGTYNEKISIYTDNLVITSKSGNPDNTLLQGPEVFNIYANKITIKGFSMRGGGTSDAIFISDWMSNCRLENNKLSNCQSGIDIGLDGFGNVMSNNKIANCKVGIGLADCREATINSNYISNCVTGIKMFDSPSNKIENNTVTENDIGIAFYGASDSNILINNKLTLNKKGLDLSAGGYQNHIYNNFFNNTVNVNFGSNIESNSWNTTKISRISVVGGPYIGGNYWATPDGNGFSQTHSDANGDGISEKTYSFNRANLDYLPLVKPIKSPVGAFSASPVSGKAPLKVQFTDRSTGSPTSRKWNFGDGTSSTIKNPAHKYGKAGKYTVTMTVKNSAGSKTKIKSGYVTVK